MRSAKPGNHLKRRFPASQKILCTVWFICLFFFVSEWKRSIVHTWVCLTEKNSSISRVYIFDGLYHRQGGGERANSKVRNRLILQTVPVCNPYAQINLLSGKGKTDRKSRTAAAQSEFHRSYSRRNKPRSCLCVHWSERSESILL